MPRLRLIPLLLLLALVAGCGQKGPLYLPDDPQSPEEEQRKPKD
jgi:predicted small lipoprotein YifL